MELSLSNEFGTRIETLLKELVSKTTHEELAKQKVDMDDTIRRVERRLEKLDAQIQTAARFRSISLNLLTSMLDELKAVHSTPIDDDDVLERSQESVQVHNEDSAPQQVHEPVTLSDVQRFLMQRQSE